MLTEIIRCLYLNRKYRKDPTLEKVGHFDCVSRSYRVKPTDLDYNLHVNNARYLNYMERSRWDHAVRSGIWDVARAKKANLIIASLEISYVREIRLFQKFDIKTRIIGFDNKYVYMEQQFFHKGKLYSDALVKMVFVKSRKVAEPADIFNSAPDPLLPEKIQHWNEMSQAKRESVVKTRKAESPKEPSKAA